jgi:biopolymer transport protein ExbD
MFASRPDGSRSPSRRDQPAGTSRLTCSPTSVWLVASWISTPLTVTVGADGKVFLQETQVQIDDLVPKLEAIAHNGYDERIFVRGDKSVGYGEVMQVMGALNAAGFRKIGLVTDSEQALAKTK